MNKSVLYFFILFIFFGCQTNNTKDALSEWQPLFNGKDLTGWTPKISGYPLGDNFGNTFRVEDGLLKVDYSEYPDSFAERFGHLFYEKAYSDYHLKIEYRFTNPQKRGEGENLDWAFKNSGVMFHAQSPQSMGLNQGFPVSLEAQFLGGNGTDDRPTANLCTPGMHVYISDTLTTEHCIESAALTFHGDEWVNFEIIVHHDSIIHHVVNGDTVISYTQPSIGGRFLPENYADTVGTPISKGYFALQSESHPIEFRKVELLDLSQK